MNDQAPSLIATPHPSPRGRVPSPLETTRCGRTAGFRRLGALAAALVLLLVHDPALAKKSKKKKKDKTEQNDSESTSDELDSAEDEEEQSESEESADTEEEADEEESDEDEDKPEKGSLGKPSALDLQLGVRLLSRSFRFTDRAVNPGELADYNLSGGPMPMSALHWYPGAHFRGDWLAHIGLSGGYERGVGTSAAYYDGAGVLHTFGENHQLFWGGLRGRIPVSMFTFGVEARYESHRFTLVQGEDPDDPNLLFAPTRYTFVSAGLDGEIAYGRMRFGAQGYFLLPFTYGAIKGDGWFPETKGIGVHYGAHVAVSVVPALDLVAGVDGRVYGLNFNPLSDDIEPERRAGGATDTYISGFFALRIRIPEKAPKSATATDEPAKAADEGGGFDSFE